MYVEKFSSLGLQDSTECIKNSVNCSKSSTRTSEKSCANVQSELQKWMFLSVHIWVQFMELQLLAVRGAKYKYVGSL